MQEVLKRSSMVPVAALVLGCGGSGSSKSAPPARAAGADSASSGAVAATASAPASAEPTVLFVGTSLTAGYGLDDPASDAYPAQVAALAERAGKPIHIVNAGLSGETSAGALRRVDWLVRAPADVIVLETGANDGLRGIDVDSTRANLAAILGKLHSAQPTARLMLVQMEAPPNLGPRYTTGFHAMFPAVAQAQGATLVPFLLEDVAGHADLNQADGIHPTPAGARIAARTVWKALEPVVDSVRLAAGR